MRRLLVSLALFGLALPQYSAAAAAKKPKLILAVVVDQFRYDYLTRFRKDYNSGLEQMLEHGAVFTNANLIAMPTVTAIGHSTFLSGATPSMSGIAGNEWYDRQTKRIITSVSDDQVKIVGAPSSEGGFSPHQMLVSTLGDEIKMHGDEAKVIGISIKARGAILPAGHMADAAYWFDADSNQWVTSTYYRTELPAWLKDLNKEAPARRYLGASWMPFDAKDSAKPYCTMVNGTDLPYCNSLEATPWGNEMIEEVAERAITGEELGKHPSTDLLAVSFSSNDYVGHALGPDSPEVRDISIRTDRLLGKFFAFAEKQAGAGNVLVVMTADHGVAPVPEISHARRMIGGRLSNETLGKQVQEALVQKYGEGKWVAANATASVYLNTELIDSKHLKKADVEDTVADAMRAFPHIFRVYTGDQLQKGQAAQDPVTRAVTNGYFPQRSADVLLIVDPFYMFEGRGTSHGTPFNYDTHVPVIFMGPGIKAGSYAESVSVNDIAPTLATMLGVQIPSGSVGRVLTEMLE